MIDLVMAFIIGLTGGIHCIGMCGGIVTALSMSGGGGWLSGMVLYHFGRTTTYSLLGLAAGLLGSLITQRGSFAGIQSGISIAAGVVMIIFALQMGGWITEKFGPLSRISIPSRLLGRAAGGSVLPWGLVGLANGLLPCGMVYAALALALKQTTPLMGAVVMLSFGVGTIPAMTGFSLIIGRLKGSLRGKFLKVAAALLVIFGLFTMARGFTVVHHHLPDHFPTNNHDHMAPN